MLWLQTGVVNTGWIVQVRRPIPEEHQRQGVLVWTSNRQPQQTASYHLGMTQTKTVLLPRFQKCSQVILIGWFWYDAYTRTPGERLCWMVWVYCLHQNTRWEAVLDGLGILPTPEHQVRGCAGWFGYIAYTRTPGERLCWMVWVYCLHQNTRWEAVLDGLGILPTPEHQVRGCAGWFGYIAYTRTPGEMLCQMVLVYCLHQVRGCAGWFGYIAYTRTPGEMLCQMVLVYCLHQNTRWEAMPDGLGKGNAYTRTPGERLCQMVWVKVMPTQEHQVRGYARWFG